jgi:flavin-binding protein dodecin
MWVKDMQVVVENERITQYRLSLKVSFLIEDRARAARKGGK